MPIRAPIPGLAEGRQELAPEVSRYLVRVLRLGAGERFVAFDPASRLEADATISKADSAGAEVLVEPLRPGIVAGAELVLVYALAKGDKVDDVVRDATELGATRIIVARTERSVVKVSEGDRLEQKRDRWKRIAEQAARQCGRADPPVIDGVYDWPDALDRAGGCEARFCLDPRAAEALGALLAPAVGRGASIAFAIGPEGGLSTDEVELAVGKGFVPASLGRFVLRTETVAAAILGAVRVLALD
jgi:16S rRNA (uracil1498-N3)-methyltransferase